MRNVLARQPQAPLPIDWGNPLTKGLVASYYNSALDYSRAPQNYVGAVDATNAAQAVTLFTHRHGAGSFSAGFPPPPSAGITPYFTAASSSSAKARCDLSQLTKRITISFWLWWSGFASNDHLMLEYTSNYNSNNGFVINLNSISTGDCDFNLHLSGNYCQVSAPRDTSKSGQWHHYAWLIDLTLASSQTTAIYYNGIAQALSQGVNAIPANSTFDANDYLYFMGRNMASLFGEGSIAHLNIHSRNLNVSEIRSLMANPLQIMLAPVRTRPALVVPGGGPVAYRWFLQQ